MWLDTLVEAEKKDIVAIDTVLKALEKKDNIIEKMTKTIIKLREDSENDCFIPRSYRDINGCIETTCDICIKEYFIKLVEDK